MKVAIMQPYFYPYIGYFQLIKSVDKFIFYDDVNYIKNGWINRNRILINGKAAYLTVELKNASPFKLINEIEFTNKRTKLLRSIELTYKKCPYFNDVFPVIEQNMNYQTNKISDLAIHSVKGVCHYLGIKTIMETSSIAYSELKNKKREERIINICKQNYADEYINASGGVALYDKDYFRTEGINLKFIIPNSTEYNQNSNEFVPGLSIIDVLMFNSIEEINTMLDNYQLA